METKYAVVIAILVVSLIVSNYYHINNTQTADEKYDELNNNYTTMMVKYDEMNVSYTKVSIGYLELYDTYTEMNKKYVDCLIEDVVDDLIDIARK